MANEWLFRPPFTRNRSYVGILTAHTLFAAPNRSKIRQAGRLRARQTHGPPEGRVCCSARSGPRLRYL